MFDFDNQSAAFFCVDTIKYYSIPNVPSGLEAVSYTHLRAHETEADLVCRLLLEKKKETVPWLFFPRSDWRVLQRSRPTHAMHGGTRMTTDPRIPTMPGRSTSGFHLRGCKHAKSSTTSIW